MKAVLLLIMALALCAGALGRSLDRAPELGDVLTTDIVLADPARGFSLWKSQHGKHYPSSEHARRLEAFRANAELVHSHNAGKSPFRLALNEFADMTFDEFRGHLGYASGAGRNTTGSVFSHGAIKDVPPSIDWVAKGAVTPVKNQLTCGSCWAFSSTGSIEGINFIKTGQLVSLSEQQLVDCSTDKNMGCSGGLMDYAFEYVEKNGGIDTEDNYGYWSFDLPCQTRKQSDRHVVSIDGHEDVPVNNGAALKKALSQQPVSVAICANSKLQFYSGGVFDEASCCTDLNHGVLAVGYSTHGDEPFWKIKNSWGESWGEAGYFRLSTEASDPTGTCGVLQAPSYPVKRTTANPEVSEFCGYFGWSECGPGYGCECQFNVFDLFCLSWGCSAKEPKSPVERALPTGVASAQAGAVAAI